MTIPAGARVRGDAIEVPISMSMRLIAVFGIAVLLFMAIGMPIDQAREGRLGPALIGSAICIPFLVFLGWFLWWGFFGWVVRVDGEGVHTFLPRRTARWEDIASVDLTGPTVRQPIRLDVPAGLVRPGGERTSKRVMWLVVRYVAGAGMVYACIADRLQRARTGGQQH